MRRPGPDEWRRLVAEYDGSTETQEAFCEARDVSLGTFRYWKYKLAKERPTRFLPVEVVGSPAPVARAGALVEVAVPGGGPVLRFEVGTDARYVAELVSALS